MRSSATAAGPYAATLLRPQMRRLHPETRSQRVRDLFNLCGRSFESHGQLGTDTACHNAEKQTHRGSERQV